MPIIRDLLARHERSLRRLPLLTGTHTASSVVVTPERALQVGSVYACVRILSEAVASLPTALYNRTPGYRTRVETHPLARLLLEYPNPDIDAGEFWRTVMGWQLIRGNGHVYIEHNQAGKPIGLWPIAPTSVEIRRTPSGQVTHRLTPDTNAEYVPVKPGYDALPGEMLHFRAFGLGIEGLSPIGMARQQIGTSFAASSYIGGFFARDASPGGVVSVPGNLTEEQYVRLAEQWKSMHEGFDNSHRLAVMEGGAKWEKTTLSPDDAKFIDVYKLTRTEIAAIYGVPPHMIGDLDRATFSNIEQQSLEFVMHSLRPWLVRLERVTKRLFDGTDTYLKFNVDGLLRGDTAARYNAYTQGRQWGWLSGNDIRRSEDMDPVKGLDEYLTPLNMVPVGTSPVQREQRQARDRARSLRARMPADEHPAWVERVHDVLAEHFDAMLAEGSLTRTVRSARAARAAGGSVWDKPLADALVGPVDGIVADFANSAADSLGGNFNPRGVVNWSKAEAARRARNINQTTLDQIDAAIDAAEDGEDAATLAAGVIGHRSSVDAALIAFAIVNAVGNFGRTEGARQTSDAAVKTWVVTSGNPRPTHSMAAGETVGIDEVFSNGLNWPGDPSGGVDEVAGCTCVVEVSVP